jgi:hypothetical protein
MKSMKNMKFLAFFLRVFMLFMVESAITKLSQQVKMRITDFIETITVKGYISVQSY